MRKKSGRNRTGKSKKYVWRKGKLLVLGNIESGHHQTSGGERKNTLDKQKRFSKPNSAA